MGLEAVDLALGLVKLGLVGPGVNHKQEVILFDLRPFLERHFHQVAGDAGADIDRLDGVGAAREVHVVGDHPVDRVADRDRRRLGRGELGRAVRTPDQYS